MDLSNQDMYAKLNVSSLYVRYYEVLQASFESSYDTVQHYSLLSVDKVANC
jgi:hypothetical protein